MDVFGEGKGSDTPPLRAEMLILALRCVNGLCCMGFRVWNVGLFGFWVGVFEALDEVCRFDGWKSCCIIVPRGSLSNPIPRKGTETVPVTYLLHHTTHEKLSNPIPRKGTET
jgi:hypothetical protein